MVWSWPQSAMENPLKAIMTTHFLPLPPTKIGRSSSGTQLLILKRRNKNEKVRREPLWPPTSSHPLPYISAHTTGHRDRRISSSTVFETEEQKWRNPTTTALVTKTRVLLVFWPIGLFVFVCLSFCQSCEMSQIWQIYLCKYFGGLG